MRRGKRPLYSAVGPSLRATWKMQSKNPRYFGTSAAAPGDKAKDLGNLETLEKHCYPKEVAEKGKWSMFRQVPADDVEQIKAMVKTKI